MLENHRWLIKMECFSIDLEFKISGIQIADQIAVEKPNRDESTFFTKRSFIKFGKP